MYTGNFFFKIPDDHNPPFPPKSLNVHREDMDLEVRWVCPLVEKKDLSTSVKWVSVLMSKIRIKYS